MVSPVGGRGYVEKAHGTYFFGTEYPDGRRGGILVIHSKDRLAQPDSWQSILYRQAKEKIFIAARNSGMSLHEFEARLDRGEKLYTTNPSAEPCPRPTTSPDQA